ncbi:hypothetical protein T03_10485 [Trichinella britovi]|uniref:Uncharacterized protein n=1 Tax=Trichinella britovi TaxID=45882 RepID=A0A0V0ZX35_TRIBR|nr:hypothetical protein T03_10485 [Trichinella britovi]
MLSLPYGNRLKKHFIPVVTRETSAAYKRLIGCL